MRPYPSPLLTVGAAGSSGVWTTVLGPQSTTNTSAGWQGFTMRQRLPASALVDATGTKLRITLRGSSGANGISVAKCYVGLAGAGTYDFAATPTQVLFGGSAAGSVGGGSQDLLSDGVTFSYSGTQDVVISWFFAASPQTDIQMNHVSGASNGFKSGDDAATVTVSGYSATATDNCAVRLLEALV